MDHLALEAHVLGLGGGEGREVVPADQRRRASLKRRSLDRVRPPQRPPDLERVPHRGGQHPVAIGSRAGVAAGVEPLGGGGSLDHGDRRGQDRVQAVGQLVGRHALELEARHLPPGVNARVGAAGNRQGYRLTEDPLQRRVDFALHRAQPRLRRPAGERRPVVGDREANDSHQHRPCRVAVRSKALDQLEEDHLGGVGATGAELDDPRVAAGTLCVARRDLLEQLVDNELVLAELGEGPAAGVQVAPLGERDQLLEAKTSDQSPTSWSLSAFC